jgi:hypothetical protein
MRAVNRASLQAVATAVETWILLGLENLGVSLLRFTGERGVKHYEACPVAPPTARTGADAPARKARAQAPPGQEGHGEEAEAVDTEEPPERKARHPRGERHLPASRRGA